MQCGADSIAGDPLGGTNLLPEDMGFCIEKILSWDLPTIFLGGGKWSFSLEMYTFKFASIWTTI